MNYGFEIVGNTGIVLLRGTSYTYLGSINPGGAGLYEKFYGGFAIGD